MTQKASNRGQLIDIARSYLSGDNFVICREDIPQMIDVLISKVKILDILHASKRSELLIAFGKHIEKEIDQKLPIDFMVSEFESNL